MWWLPPSPGLGGYCGEEIGGCGGPPWAAHKKLPNPLPRSQLTPCGLLQLPAGEEAQRGFRDQRIRVRSLAFAGCTTRGYSATVGRKMGVLVSGGRACTGSLCEGGVRVIRLGCEVREKGSWELLCCQVSHARRGPCPGCVVSLWDYNSRFILSVTERLSD